MQNKRIQIIVIVVFVIILGVCLYYAYPFQSSIKLGLDLKGGTQIILKPSEIGAEKATDSALDKAQLVIMNRIDKLGKAQAGYDSNGRIVVSMAFTTQGQTEFAKVTSENVGKQLAIVLDGEMKSAPRIQQAIEGDAVIEGIDTLAEAQDIALVLQTGALPVNLEMQEVQTIGPTLGQDSLRQSILAGIIGVMLIAIFMVAMYRGLGLISLIGLTSYIIIFWGILAALKTPITLPGIAGVILTIGIAVDANVLIFARIKEEMIKGKGKYAAFSEGFRNALKAIIDSNVTTLITAAALYRFGTGPIRGFAVTLAIGVFISLLTAVILTRSILFLMVNSRVVTPGFIGVKLPKITREAAKEK